MNPEKIFKFALVVLGLCSLITLGVVGYVQYTNNRNFGRAYDIAQQLGHQPEVHMLQSRQCWDFLSANCGIYIHFTSDLDVDVFGARVDTLPLTLLPSAGVNGGKLFNEINDNTGHRLTVNGHDSPPAYSSRPSAHRWSLEDQDGKHWSIIFYELKDGPRYEFDGQLIMDNIVSVMFQFRD